MPKRSPEVVRVTVVVPCYNYAQYLPSVVASALDQERVEVDVIVVDDASTDGSLDVARRLSAADPRVQVLRHSSNTGHIKTYNDGLTLATGDYVVLLSADDLLTPGSLARATDLMQAHPGVGMVYGLPLEFEGDPPPFRWRPVTWTIWQGSQWGAITWRTGRNFILSPEVVMRRTALEDVGLYNPAAPHAGDLELWLRTAARWDVGRINGPAQAYYRVHPANMHLTRFATMQTDLTHRLQAFESASIQRAEPDGPALALRARRALARESMTLALRRLDSGASSEEVKPLVDFGYATWPTVQRTRLGRAVRSRLTRRGPAASVPRRYRLEEAARVQVDRARWRMWRAAGVR